MLNGTKEQVKRAAMECLEALAPCGGFMLGDGANVCPGTPRESFEAIMEAAEEYGTGGESDRLWLKKILAPTSNVCTRTTGLSCSGCTSAWS
jgi:hypothetical protein